MNKNAVVILLFFVCGLTFGCTGNYPLKGRVTFADDGSPLEFGFVCFDGEKGLARGAIRKDGSYIVGFSGAADGIPPGTYNVYITGASIADPNDRNSSIPLVAAKQCRADTSGWTITIDGKIRVYDLQVDRAPPPKKKPPQKIPSPPRRGK